MRCGSIVGFDPYGRQTARRDRRGEGEGLPEPALAAWRRERRGEGLPEPALAQPYQTSESQEP